MLRSGKLKGTQLWVVAVALEDEELLDKIVKFVNQQPGAEVRKTECVVRPNVAKEE